MGLFWITALLAAAPTPYEGDELGECTDRADNDRNTFFDCLDPGCKGSPDCAAFVVVDGPEKMVVGDKTRLRGTQMVGYMLLPEQPTMTWTSDNPKVLTVSNDGVVEAIAPGKAVVVGRVGSLHSDLVITVLDPKDAGQLATGPVLGLIDDGAGAGWFSGEADPSVMGGPIGFSSPPETEEPVVLGALDRTAITAVVKRNMNQINYCYQRELKQSPSLRGRVMVEFVIAKDGSVFSAATKVSTLNNPTVEACINGRFLRFQFPEPNGGGMVIVSYPFEFSPGQGG